MKSLSLIQAIVLLHDQKRPNRMRPKILSDLPQFEHTWENIATGWSSPKLILHLEPLKEQRYLKEEEGMYTQRDSKLGRQDA